MQFYETFLSSDTYVPEERTDYADIPFFSDEAIFVYSLVEMKIMHAAGWQELLGYENDEISMQMLIGITTPDYADFIREMNNQSLAFILEKRERLDEYSCTIESKKYNKAGDEVSLLESVRVYRSAKGRVTELLGRYKLNPRITNPNDKYFHASGPGIEVLVDKMKKFGDEGRLITRREHEILKLLAGGMILNDIANHLGVSKSNIEKKIYGLFKKFNVRNQRELIIYSIKKNLI
jgi:DNA-binding CsgD family transcriptional regulator